MASLTEIQKRLLDSIESEMDLLIQLRRKYNLGFKLYTRMHQLLMQQEAILNNYYWLERRSLGDNRYMAIAYFEDGSVMTSRYTLDEKVIEIG